MKNKRSRLVRAGIAAVVVGSSAPAMLAGTATAQQTQQAQRTQPGDAAEVALAPVRRDIIRIARAEYLNRSHNRERPMGSNCNYYSYRLGSGSRCGNGWRSVAWCADFARYVWRGARVDHTGVLNSYADSFRQYGRRYGEWYPVGSRYVPKPGDAVVYRDRNGNGLADHVGIVYSYTRGRLVTIEGNWDNKITQRVNPRHIWGYTRPIRR